MNDISVYLGRQKGGGGGGGGGRPQSKEQAFLLVSVQNTGVLKVHKFKMKNVCVECVLLIGDPSPLLH